MTPTASQTEPLGIRIPRKDILPETLDVFELPWEYDDTDGDYIIIKKRINDEFQQQLYRHTAESRKSGLGSNEIGRNNSNNDTKRNDRSRLGGTDSKKSDRTKRIDSSKARDKALSAPIEFEDAVGRKFMFPFELAKKWVRMEDLICQAFIHVDVIGPHVKEGHYDLIDPSGYIILPQAWDMTIEPGWTITQKLWPLPENPPLSEEEKPVQREHSISSSSPSSGGVQKPEPSGNIKPENNETSSIQTVRIRGSGAYVRPKDDDDNALNLEVNLGNEETFRLRSMVPRSTQQFLEADQDLQQRYGFQSLTRASVMSARRYWDGERRSGVAFDYFDDVSRAPETQFRWIHAQAKLLNFDKFIDFLSELPDLSEDEISLATVLLRRLKKMPELSNDAGRRLGNVVRRVDSQNDSDITKWVTFLNVPYLSTHKNKSEAEPNERYAFTQSLAQYQYPLEAPTDLDRRSMDDPAQNLSEAHTVHVPIFWALLTSSGTLITICFEHYDNVCKHYLQPTRLNVTGGTNSQRRIRIRDYKDRMFHFPLDLCDSYFALMRAIATISEGEEERDPSDYAVLDSNGRRILAAGWQRYCNSQSGMFIDVTVRLLSTTAPPVPEHEKLLVSNKAVWTDEDDSSEVAGPIFDKSFGRLEVHNNDSLEGSEVRHGDSFNHSRAKQIKQPIADSPSISRQSAEAKDSADGLIVLDNKLRAPVQDVIQPQNELLAIVLSRARTEREPSFNLPPNRVPRYLSRPEDPIFANFTNPCIKRENIFYQFDPVLEHSLEKIYLEGHDGVREGRVKGAEALDNAQGTKEAQDNGLPGSAAPEVPPFFFWSIKIASKPNSALGDSGDSHAEAHIHRDKDGHGVISKNYTTGQTNIHATKEQQSSLQTILKGIHMTFQRAKFDDIDKSQSGRFLARLYRDVEAPADIKVVEEGIKSLCMRHTGVIVEENPQRDISWQGLLAEVIQRWDHVSSSFCPKDTDDIVHQKLRHCRAQFFKYICALCEPQFSWSGTERADYKTERKRVYIVEPSQVFDERLTQFITPTQPIRECRECQQYDDLKSGFASPDAARAHLRQHHYQSQALADTDLNRCIIPANRLNDFIACANGYQVMSQILDHLREMVILISSIKYGVTADGQFTSSTYLLPKSLVLAFRQFLTGVICATQVIHTAYNEYLTAKSRKTRLSRISSTHMERLVLQGLGVEHSLSRAKSDLMLMGHAGDYSSSASYETVDAPYVLITLLRNLIERTKPGLTDMYWNQIQHLSFQAKHRPRRRLRNKILRLREEIGTVQAIAERQRFAMEHLGRVLQPRSFKVTSRQRQQQNMLEEQIASETQDVHSKTLDLFEFLISKLDALERETLKGIELQQDDHGKAILVVTIVTVVFLPLSFATSFLGMNTRDIRSTDSGQSLFWVIALPLTIFTTAIVVSIGLFGDQIQDAIAAGAFTASSALKLRGHKNGTEELHDDEKKSASEIVREEVRVTRDRRQWLRSRLSRHRFDRSKEVSPA